MKQRTLIRLMTVIVVLTVALAVRHIRTPRSNEHAAPPSAASQVTGNPGSPEALAGSPRSADPFRRPLEPARPRRLEPAQPRRLEPTLTEVRVSAAQTLMMVNQTPVRLGDLMPVRSGEVEKTLTSEEYDSRLQRAIEMELTFQAARDRGVELTAAQQQRVAQIAERHQANLEHYEQYGATWISISPERMEFEERLLAAQMLEQNLVAQSAAVSPSPDPERQKRYEQARRELLDQLRANAYIFTVASAL